MPHITLLCGILVLSACTTLGPDYREPEVSWLEDWQALAFPSSKPAKDQKEADLQFWWQLFNDPVLTELIERVKRDNLSLRIAGLRILESRALLGIAGSGLYPQLQQANSAVNYVNTHQHGGTLPDTHQNLTSYQAGFNLAWELDFWGRFRRSVESADAVFFASIANQQDIQVLISAQVTDLYFSYRSTEALITIARENAAIQKRSYEITEQKFTSGEDSELDLQQAKTQYLVTLSGIPQLESSLIKLRNALSVLLGRAPENLAMLVDPEYKLPRIELTHLQYIPARLLIRRPDIRAAAWQVAAQSAQIGIAEADYYPAISLLGGLTWSGSDQNTSPETGSFILGPALRWNLFDHGRIKNNVRVQDARLQQLIEIYQASVLQAAREIEDAAITVKKTAEAQVLIDSAVIAAERSLELANSRYHEGYADFQRVLDAQRALFVQAERQLTNHTGHLSAVVSLYKGLGGGWVAMPVEQLIPGDIRKTMQERSDWDNLLIAPLPELPAVPVSINEASPQ